MHDAARSMAVLMGVLASLSFFVHAPAVAQGTAPPVRACFYTNQFESWKAPDSRTIYIRVNLSRYYRLDLAGECSELRTPGTHLIMNVRGPDTICSALDWDLKVAHDFHDIPEPCIVKAMTPLSPAEAAAIPKGSRP